MSVRTKKKSKVETQESIEGEFDQKTVDIYKKFEIVVISSSSRINFYNLSRDG